MINEWMTKLFGRSWLTTVIGIIGGVYTILEPILRQGRLPTANEWVIAFLIAAFGWASKAFNVSGEAKKKEEEEGTMKNQKGITVIELMVALVIFFGIATMLCSCASVVKQTQKIDASMASYLGVEKLSPDCKAAIAQVDADISSDPVNVKNIQAVTKYADKESKDYKQCYTAMAWVYYGGKKIEGAVRTWLKKLTEMAVFQ